MNTLLRSILKFFDKLEDKTRSRLSRNPLLYAILGGIGIVLFWRGVWHIADELMINSVLSITMGTIILLITGVFVSAFIGNSLIMSGLSGDKKLAEKTAEEVETEEAKIRRLQNTINRVEEKLDHIETHLHPKK